MSIDQTSPLSPLRPNVSATTTDRDAERQQIKRLAQEFEAMLMTQMLREMRKSMLDTEDQDEDTGFGAATMTDTMDIELGQALSRAGGFGLARQLFRSLEREVESSKSESPTPRIQSAAAPGTPSPAAQPPVALTMELNAVGASDSESGKFHVPSGTVTSAFGWRRDPFTGEARFHKGVDIAMAYGRDIQAAAAGRVVFAGEQGSCGNLVVIEHPSGQQTRYAHLSAIGVRAGDQIDEGQVIGQAGATGRATGVHLHFEVVSNGRALDPGTDNEAIQAAD
jgi:murein DD-endopeptidase MepM/ murein hydrolase activator NlpD